MIIITLYGDKLNNLQELKGEIYRSYKILPHMLKATIENAVMSINILSDNGRNI